MNTDRELARSALIAILGELVDPKYAKDPIRAEAELKKAVRATWKHRFHYPPFIGPYMAKWESEAKP